MKQHGHCPKCGSDQVIRIPGGTMSGFGSAQNFVPTGFRMVKIDRRIPKNWTS